MSDAILAEIRNKIADLEPYRYTQKLIVSVDDLGLEMNQEMSHRYFELTGRRTHGIKSRDDPVQIQIIEELGEKALPLALREISLLPGQRWYKIEDENGVNFYTQWTF